MCSTVGAYSAVSRHSPLLAYTWLSGNVWSMACNAVQRQAGAARVGQLSSSDCVGSARTTCGCNPKICCPRGAIYGASASATTTLIVSQFAKSVRAAGAADWAEALRRREWGWKEGPKERVVQRGSTGVAKLHAAPGAQAATVVKVAR